MNRLAGMQDANLPPRDAAAGRPAWTALVMVLGHARDVGIKPVPLHRVAGLSVLGRQVLAARHGGAMRCCLVTPPGFDVLAEEARRLWNRPDGFDVVRVAPDASETEAIRAAVRPQDHLVIILFADLSFSRNLLQALLQEGLDDLDALVAVGEPERFGSTDCFHRPIGSEHARFSGVALISGELAGALPAGVTMAEALERVAPTKRVRLRPMENSFSLRIQTPSDLKLAEKKQLQALRRNYDGIVSRWLNRPVSLFLSRYLFLRLPFTPNQITLISSIFGWAGIMLVILWPAYWWVLLGAFLFHFSSILDGCDGEIARLRYQFSRFGEWLDNLLDEINNTAFVAAIGIGVFRSGGHELLAWAAGFYGLVIAICDSAVFYQLARWRGGTGNFEKFRWFFEGEKVGPPPNPTAYPPRRSLSGWLKELPRRDFYIFLFLLLAVFDRLIVGFWIAVAVGAVVLPLGIIQWIHELTRRDKLPGQ